jgi:rhamnosyltransferase
MRVAVIIPTRNGGKDLKRLLRSLKKQSVKSSQILVVDSSSDDDTSDICKAFGAAFIRIDAKSFDHGRTRNFAAARAEGEIIVFLTQDALFKNHHCLKNLIKPLEFPMIAASFARQIPKRDANPVEVFVRSFNSPSVEIITGVNDLPRLGIKTFFFSNACSAVKKKVFEEVGGFPEKIIMNEDMLLAAKLIMKGYKVAYQADAVVYHSHNYSLADQFRRYFDIGVFFSRNRWIMNLASAEREGLRYLKEEVKFLSRHGRKSWIPRALVDTVARFLGYQAGLSERKLPLFFKKKASYNKGFWENDAPSS